MNNYVRAEVYRIIHKKSMYTYLTSLLLLFFMYIFILSSAISPETLQNDANLLFNFLPILLGSYLFSIIYNDDLHAKTLPSLIGFGKSKVRIILSKLIIAIVMTALSYVVALLVFCIAYNFLIPMEASFILELMIQLLFPFLTTIGYMVIASTITYAIQKPTFVIVTYILLSVQFINNMLSMFLNMGFIKNVFGNVSQYTITNIANSLTNSIVVNDFNITFLIIYITMLCIFIILSVIVFTKKELEF